ncbi:hypothetical protein BLGI_662 [Brevibacillus laterosporus GI-9]|nr:hypothetical protein BLGI_662 [Brevibacillus laterosporus GI-9]
MSLSCKKGADLSILGDEGSILRKKEGVSLMHLTSKSKLLLFIISLTCRCMG